MTSGRDSDTPTLGYENLGLEGGWSAVVLTSAAGAVAQRQLPGGPPNAGQWHRFLRQLILNPSSLAGYQVLKASRTGTVIQVSIAHEPEAIQVVCKQRSVGGFWRGLLRPLRKTAERRDFDRGRALLAAGIATAIPCACLTQRRSPRRSWLVTVFLPKVVDLDRIVLAELPRLSGATLRRAKNALAQALADLVHGLDTGGLHHRDLKASNVLLGDWLPDGSVPTPYLVDLEGLGAGRSHGDRLNPVVRLAASLLDYDAVTRTDYLRFLRQYLSTASSGPGDWKTQFRSLAERAIAYNQLARLRKSHKLDGFQGAD